MADYAVVVSERAAREIEDLPARTVSRVYAKLVALGSQPRPAGVKKLKGELNLYGIDIFRDDQDHLEFLSLLAAEVACSEEKL